MPEQSDEPLLRVRDVSKTFAPRRRRRRAPISPGEGRGNDAPAKAVDQVSLELRRGQILGIAGESGSGKSTVVRLINRLHEPDEGHITFDGSDVLALDVGGLRALRRRVQIVFQDPYSSLNPRLSVTEAIYEVAHVHGFASRSERNALVDHHLDQVKLPRALADRRPRDLSGGQRQRVAIARAMAARPDLLIADEATSALDVSVQTEIVNLLLDLRESDGLSIIFVSHQLPVLAGLADNVVIMQRGRVVESAPVEDVFARPQHEYTRGLVAAYPKPRPELFSSGRTPS